MLKQLSLLSLQVDLPEIVATTVEIQREHATAVLVQSNSVDGTFRLKDSMGSRFGWSFNCLRPSILKLYLCFECVLNHIKINIKDYMCNSRIEMWVTGSHIRTRIWIGQSGDVWLFSCFGLSTH
jgi:hypothetical protein